MNNSLLSSHLKALKDNPFEFLDFGQQPVSNRFLSDDNSRAPLFDFRLGLDRTTGLIYLSTPFPVEELKPRYDWLTCFEPEAHLDDMATRISRLPGVNEDSVIGAYSFKDDTTLRRLEKLGMHRTWRIDPVHDLGVNDPTANVETYQEKFTLDKAQEIARKHGLADIFIVRHVIEHSYDLNGFIEACRACTKPGGWIIYEAPDCVRALDLGDHTTLWEEHLFYFTPFTFRWILQASGFEIYHFESHPYPFENSLIAFVRNVRDKIPESLSASEVASECARAHSFAKCFSERKIKMQTLLEKTRQQQGTMALFGAGHLSVAFLALYGITNYFDCVVDDNPHKKGMYMPVGGLPIVGSHELLERKIKVCLLSLNPQNQPRVIEKNTAFSQAGGIFASIFPGSENEIEKVLV